MALQNVGREHVILAGCSGLEAFRLFVPQGTQVVSLSKVIGVFIEQLAVGGSYINTNFTFLYHMTLSEPSIRQQNHESRVLVMITGSFVSFTYWCIIWYHGYTT